MGAGHSDELSLFYSSNPIGDEWIPHPKNPIISDRDKNAPKLKDWLKTSNAKFFKYKVNNRLI